MSMMKSIPIAVSAAAALAAGAALGQQADQESAVYELDCDRECLLDVLGAYMDALRAGSPSSAPVAEDVVFTENNVVIPHGKGLWGTVDTVDEVGLEAADTQTQNAAWFGSAVENGEPVIYAVRVHVSDRRIDEVESVVHRLSELPTPFGDTTNLTHDPEFDEILPPEKRRPRARMRAIADAYFDTVELNDGEVFAPFADDCSRLENAMRTASVDEEGGELSDFVDGCEAQFRMGYFLINKRVRERTYPIIDEERGVVVATGFFDHANEWDRYLLTDGTERETWLKWPNSITLLEAFRINDGEIQRIEAVFTYVPYFMHNPWTGEATSPPVPVTSPEQCDSRCLAGLADQVMNAYVNRGEWRNLPWAEKVGYEENGVGMQVNEGIWGSTTAVDEDPLIIADEILGRALWIGRIEAHGQPAWAAVTVSADGDKIGRIEAVIRRKEYAGPYAEPGTAPSFSALRARQRTPRADMLAAVDRYYHSVGAKTGTAPADLAADCRAVVNGQELYACAKPFTDRLRQNLEQVRDRKVIAVDVARGLVAISAYEDYPATVQEFTDAAGGTYEDILPYPRTLQVVDLFRVENGSITRIESYTSELAYGAKPR